MPNWLSSMQQSYEFYVVDPGTWMDKARLTLVKSCSITRDSSVETLGSATFDLDEYIGECYVRVYLITVQNGIKEKFPLGTFLVQTVPSSFDGKSKTISAVAYTPLLELKESQPPLGYSFLKEDIVMDKVYMLTREHARAPVVKALCDTKMPYDFVADTSDTWLSFLSDLMAHAKYSFELDENGRILFSPKQELSALRPVWTYTDDNSSILRPEITDEQDLYEIPNVVEVIYSTGYRTYYARAINKDPDSPVSIVQRGREITHRITDPDMTGTPSQDQVTEYAKLMLKELSKIEHTVTYTHGYCPVRVGDCVRLNYARSGLVNVKARVVSQTINCETGCSVTEKAIYTTDLLSDSNVEVEVNESH